MDEYELYCLADPLFYDTLDQQHADTSDFPLARGPVPDGWVRRPTDTWMCYEPRDEPPLPSQGWKIHVSASVEEAERALTVVWDYCVPRKIAFKFLRSAPVHVMRNSKAAPRGGSGKLVTIYPRDDGRLELTLKELHELLRGVKGAYILSDLRYGEGPLYVRYGGFLERKLLSETGEQVLAIEDGQGRLVPDVRGATFAVPPWVTLPDFLEPHLAARNSVTITELPYEIESVLHFSNGGGVYLGRHRDTGERVVLKEARPHAGLDAAGRDAVTRLARERDILRHLSELDVVPAFLDYLTVGEHHFLVMEFIDGNPLQRLLVRRYPLARANCSEETIATYTRWALDMLSRVESAVAAIHERGVVFGDLHPNNILVTAAGRLALIDFEAATMAEENARATLAAPAYAAPADRRGMEIDRYALACMRIGMFGPQTTTTISLHPAKAAQLAGIVTDVFPVPPGMFDEAVRTIRGAGHDARADAPEASWPMPRRDEWPKIKDALRRAILASATPERDDRLFPGDVRQFRPGGGLNIAHGAAGVLYALAEAGAETSPEHADWLRKRALNPDPRSSLGFYDGLHGVAYVLDRLGHRGDALDIVDGCLRERWEPLESGLFSGLAGIGLNLLHLSRATGERSLFDAATKVVDICADRMGEPDDVPEISGGENPRAGLMYGSAGLALLFLHAYERSGDTGLLDKAADALRQDLRRCIKAEDGSLQVNQGWRHLPYLDEGSVGVGLVLARYLTHSADEAFSRALGEIHRIIRSRFFVQPGLFTGRSGIIAALGLGLGATRDALDPAVREQVHELVRGLRWHSLPYTDGLAFPGDRLLRLSMDFATGTAGVLFALSVALGEGRACLPFVEPPGGAGTLAELPPAHHSAGWSPPCEPRKEV
jgi:serine/threonine protein kinase